MAERQRQRQREPLGVAGCLMKGELVKKKKKKNANAVLQKQKSEVCGVFRCRDDDSGSIFAVEKFQASANTSLCLDSFL